MLKHKLGLKVALPLLLAVIICLILLAHHTRTQSDQSSTLFGTCPNCNVVLITMTNLRYDHMSADGYSRNTTPNLDKFSQKSLIFDNAFSQESWTLPEGMSIYTSLYPFEHGVMDRYDGSTLSPKTPTIIETLKKNGYVTSAFTGGFDYNPEFGLTGRLDHYEECTNGKDSDYPREQGPKSGTNEYGHLTCSIPKALAWVRQNADKKFFLHVQGFDAHCPFSQAGGKTYDPNYKGTVNFSDCLFTLDRSTQLYKDGQKYYQVYSPSGEVLLDDADVSHLKAIYDEAINSSDKVIGDFLAQLDKMGLLNHTIVIFTSEHGDMFGKYGRFMRGGPARGTFYDDVLHIPLVIYYPKVTPKRVDGLVQQIDLAPTIFGLLGIKDTFPMEGKSLLPLIANNTPVDQYVFAGAAFNSNGGGQNSAYKMDSEVVRSKEWKLIEETVYAESGTITNKELYHVLTDKEEAHNLKDVQKDELTSMENILQSWSKRVKGQNSWLDNLKELLSRYY